MMKTPERIWLREDHEDPDHVEWGGDQPADGGVEYIKVDDQANKPVLTGWVCPVCGRGNSPYCLTCPCVDKTWMPEKIKTRTDSPNSWTISLDTNTPLNTNST